MDELLQRDIFSDDELTKLSPDYIPTNVLLRIQARSTMVKDTHSHNFKDENCQRKSIKRPKETFKFGKEIVKIRNGFEQINLKNQIMLKNAVKAIDGIKADDVIAEKIDECMFFGKEGEKYFQDISEMNLELKNNSEFKLNDKPKLLKNDGKPNRNIKKKTDITSNKNIVADDNDNLERTVSEHVGTLLKIECRTLNHTENVPKDVCVDPLFNDEHSISEGKSPNSVTYNATQKDVDKDVNDLQSLLVMLAISPKMTENSDYNEVKTRNVVENTRLNEMKGDTQNGNTQVSLRLSTSESTQSNDCISLNTLPMRIEINDREQVMLKTYVAKWKAFIIKKKEVEKLMREQTLNCFFDKLTKKKLSCCETPETPANKAKLLARDYNRYRHRYQMQKHIIALQKAKLEEQSRIIEELKYNRIVDASKISVDAMKNEVRKTYYDMDKHLKPKLKCLTNELKIDIEDPSLVLHCLKVPQFLQRMEKRAREREEKHALIRERRLQMEEERKRLKQQEELAKAQMDKEEKLKRMQELKEKRKKEKIEGIRKKQYADRMRALTVMADLHYEKSLKLKYAIRPLRMLIGIKRDNIEKAKAHYKFQLEKNVFLHWMWLTEDIIFERNYKAEDFYRKKMLRKCFDALKKNHNSLVLKKQVAEDYYDLFLTNLVFRKFKEAIGVVKKEHEMKWDKAVLYHNSNLVFRVFSCWRTLPALNALKREQEARKARWREKVLQVVPDYTPPDD